MSDLGIWEGLIGHGQTIGERSSQQDYYIVQPLLNENGEQSLLMVLADGMGGHVGGEIASQLSSQAFLDEFEETNNKHSLVDSLKASIVAADNAINLAVEENEALLGMGTTLVGAYWDGRGLSWASIGDSPMWIARQQDDGSYRLDRANDDHSLKPLIEKRLKEGAITKKQASEMASHQLRSAIVGEGLDIEDEDKVNIYGDTPVRLYKNEYLIIASDGLETLSEKRISEIIQLGQDAQDIATRLLKEVQLINKQHQDNTTLLVFKVPDGLEPVKGDFKIPKSAKMMTVRITPS